MKPASDALPHMLVMGLLACAMILGGGGSPSPLAEIALQIIAAAVAVGLLYTLPAHSAALRLRDPAWKLALLILILPLLQLVPLPPLIWHALPGREAQRAALALVGAENSWRSWSALPDRTFASLLAMLPPVLLMIMTASMPGRWQRRMVAMIAAIGCLSLIVGAGQLASGPGSMLRFYHDRLSYLQGFQANHNSTADVLLITLLAITATGEIWASRRGQGQPGQDRRIQGLGQFTFLLGIAAVSLVLMLGIVLTASRAGIALIPVANFFQLAILRRHLHVNRQTVSRGALALVIISGFGWVLLRNNLALAHVVARFDFTGEFRPEIWKDAVVALRHYWPSGAGMGTFIPVFMAAERLEVLDPMIGNRAHNDFLEFAIEGGLPAVLIMLAISVMLVRAAWRALQQTSPGGKTMARFASGSLLIIALHSLVDYPLRSMALSCLAAVAAGLLLAPARRGRAVSDETAKVEG